MSKKPTEQSCQESSQAIEDVLVSALEQRRYDLIALCGDLIRQRSDNPPGDERQICDFLTESLREVGLNEIEVISAKKERPNLIVRVRGHRPGKRIVFVAHTDTKPVGDTRALWRTDPFEPVIVGGRLYGLGATDMKGALAAMIYAAAVLREHAPFCGELVLALVADEEAGGKYGADIVATQEGFTADAAIIGEPSGIEREWESLHLGCRGVCCFNIAVTGTQMHSSLSDRLPSVNASVKLGRLMDAMSSKLKLNYEPHPLCPSGPTINVGVRLRGGVNFGVYPGFAEFSCDVRTLPGMTLEQVEKDIQSFLDLEMELDPDLKAELRFQPPPANWIAPTEIAPDHDAVHSLLQAAKIVLGTDVPLTLYPAGTDAPKFQYLAGIPTVPSFGPGLISVAHGANEWVGVEAIVQAAKIYALAAWNLLA